MDYQTFIANCPEFRQTDPTFVQAQLDAATARIGGPDTSVWPSYAAPGSKTLSTSDLAQKAWATYLLRKSPQGRATATDGKDTGAEDALKEFREYENAVAGGFALSGGGLPCGPWWP